jgi:hypothetical protein
VLQRDLGGVFTLLVGAPERCRKTSSRHGRRGSSHPLTPYVSTRN